MCSQNLRLRLGMRSGATPNLSHAFRIRILCGGKGGNHVRLQLQHKLSPVFLCLCACANSYAYPNGVVVQVCGFITAQPSSILGSRACVFVSAVPTRRWRRNVVVWEPGIKSDRLWLNWASLLCIVYICSSTTSTVPKVKFGHLSMFSHDLELVRNLGLGGWRNVKIRKIRNSRI